MDGTGVPIVTPFTVEESVDHVRLQTFTQALESAGIDFFVPCGSTSEAPLLTEAERAAVIETVVETTSKPVMAGTGANGYNVTIDRTEAAAEVGADAALVLTPHYFPLDDADFIEYYRRVAENSPIPIYLYSVPPFTNVSLDPGVVVALASHENIHGIKDSSGNITRLQRMIKGTNDADFDVLTGSGSGYGIGLAVGASGGILALANVVPELCDQIYQLHRGGEIESALALNRALVELEIAITSRYGIAGVKAAIATNNPSVGPPRTPLQSLTADEQSTVEAIFAEALDAASVASASTHS